MSQERWVLFQHGIGSNAHGRGDPLVTVEFSIPRSCIEPMLTHAGGGGEGHPKLILFGCEFLVFRLKRGDFMPAQIKAP